MNYNLDKVIDREGTGSNKWELYRGGSHAGPIVPIDPKRERDGPIPMWVADMDFASPQPVLDALSERIIHGIFGYTSASEGYYSSIVSWFENRHDWKISKILGDVESFDEFDEFYSPDKKMIKKVVGRIKTIFLD